MLQRRRICRQSQRITRVPSQPIPSTKDQTSPQQCPIRAVLARTNPPTRFNQLHRNVLQLYLRERLPRLDPIRRGSTKHHQTQNLLNPNPKLCRVGKLRPLFNAPVLAGVHRVPCGRRNRTAKVRRHRCAGRFARAAVPQRLHRAILLRPDEAVGVEGVGSGFEG
uniref:(northern house mosquito) hypothetical protein n=1 Tax=Culex pipiens TaxID=7175 RepID=A0A8D8I2S9_CULPI